MPVFRAKHFSRPVARDSQAESAGNVAASIEAAFSNASPDDTSVYVRAAMAMDSLAESLPQIEAYDRASRIPEVIVGGEAELSEGTASDSQAGVEQVLAADAAAAVEEISPAYRDSEPASYGDDAALRESELANLPFVEEPQNGVPYGEEPQDETPFGEPLSYDGEDPNIPPESSSGAESAYDAEDRLESAEGVDTAYEQAETLPNDSEFPVDGGEAEAETSDWSEGASEGEAVLPEDGFIEDSIAEEPAREEETSMEQTAAPLQDEPSYVDEGDEDSRVEEPEGLTDEESSEAPDEAEESEGLEEFVVYDPIEITAIEAPQAVVFPHEAQEVASGEELDGEYGGSASAQALVRYDTRRLAEGRAAAQGLNDQGEDGSGKGILAMLSRLGAQQGSSADADQQFNAQAFLVAAAAALVIVGGTILLIAHPWNPGTNAAHPATEQQIDTSEVGSLDEIETLSGQDDTGDASSTQDTAAQATFDQLSSYYQRLLQLRANVGDSDVLLRASLEDNNADVIDAGLETAFQLSTEVGELCDQIDAVDTSAGVYADERNTLSELATWLRNWSDTLVEGWNALDVAEGEEGLENARATITRDDKDGVNEFQTLFDEGIAQFTLAEPSRDAA